MLAFLVLFFIITVFVKIIAMLITHLVFKDQFDWFKERQQEKGKSTSYFVFLFKFWSLLSPQSLFHTANSPDLSNRVHKLIIGIWLIFLVFIGVDLFSQS